ncbi:MAG: dihydropteroate synthase, partial [Acinetobacter sp.]|nr:dihydropteroate synthase [Acinetobacter sp.]
VTPDSFSDGGRYQHIDQAVARAEQMIAEGATILDIGGESTRPNAPKVSLEEELQRVIPVVQAVAHLPVLLSIDTSQPEVIRQAVQAGADIWNDVRALSRPHAIETAAALDIPVILMHMRGEPDTMNGLAQYDDVCREVRDELLQRVQQVQAGGVKAEHIILDLGFGFAKNTQHNVQLVRHFTDFMDLGYPLLAGASRKRFIGDLLNITQADERVMGSVATHLLCVQQGASIVRVHDVKATADALNIWKNIASD